VHDVGTIIGYSSLSVAMVVVVERPPRSFVQRIDP
jgi:hypothetical protein